MKRTSWVSAAGLALSAIVAARADLITNVPEASGYVPVFTYNIPNSAALNNTSIPYALDNSGSITRGSFDRIAYYFELQTSTGPLQYMYVSMDAFTDDARRIGIPNRSGGFFQRTLSNANIVSNVTGIATGTGISTCNIEFWPTNYTYTNSFNVPGASTSVYDFGDQPTQGGYGSMQIHNYGAAQTLFAYNRWGGGSTGTSDLGIGNSAIGSNPDYTFRQNATDYTVKQVQVLVRPGIAPISARRLQILTLGDSITDGANNPGGYRTRLAQRLTNDGIRFEFVGSQVGSTTASLLAAGQIAHEGHSGYRIDQIADNLDGLASSGSTNNGGYWLNNMVWPDFILLHIGTNDFGQNYNITTAKDRFDALITKLTTLRPNANIIVTSLLQRADNLTADANIDSMFNPYVPGIIDAHKAKGEHVYYLDLNPLIDPYTQTVDKLHPNAAGDQIMADAFFDAIMAVPEPTGLLWVGLAAVLLKRRVSRASRASHPC